MGVGAYTLPPSEAWAGALESVGERMVRWTALIFCASCSSCAQWSSTMAHKSCASAKEKYIKQEHSFALHELPSVKELERR